MKRIYVSTLVSVAAGVASVGLIAGCASNSGSSTAASTSSSSSSGGNSAFSAYEQCLSQHGVTLPSGGAFAHRSPGAGGFTRPTGARTGGYGGGYGGFGGGGAFASANPAMAAAVQACASDRPTGAAGGFGGFGGGSSRLTAFRNCMTQQGEAIPTTRPTAVASGDARYLGGLSTTDPKVAAALAVCKPLIPTGAPTSASTAG
jgi:hypothetical protein